VHNIAVIRLIQGRLAWYPPGASDEPRWLDDDLAAQRLRATLAQHRSRVCFAAPGTEVRLLSLTLSPEEKKHLRKSLPFMLEEQVAADIDDLHFAAGAVADDRVPVAVCERDHMERWQELLAPWPGIRQWLPEPLLLPWQHGQWCIVLEADYAIVRTGQCTGFCIERAMLEVMLEGALTDGMPSQVIIYGEQQAEDVASLPASLRENSQWRRGNLYTAMMLVTPDDAPLNLLQGSYAPQLPLQRWWRDWRAVAAVFAAALLVQLASTYVDYRQLAAENLALRAAVQDSYRQANPRGAVSDAERQLKGQLDALRGTASSSGFVSLVNEVGAVIARRSDTRIASINYSDKAGEMRMNILAGDYAAVERVRSDINAAGLEAVMESSSAQGDQVRARLRVGTRS
tara:strand:- start:164723 stop:165922 length:1200 start_codon:yes stop_codon:yes gene_type:complete